MKRICKNCKHSIRKRDRWKVVHHRFLFFHWTTTVHHNCTAPEMGPAKPRLKGEVPLPFDGPIDIGVVYRNSKTGEESYPTPRQEIANI